jgi:2-iminobutanoate/2-iminopropanoate deaminase
MKNIVNTSKAPAPVGPYSQAVLSDDTLYISGQIPMNPETNQTITQSIKSQTMQVMENIRQILLEAGMDFSNVVKSSIFITNIEYFNEVNEVYASYFSKDFPARETVQVSKLPKNVDVEISMIAVK